MQPSLLPNSGGIHSPALRSSHHFHPCSLLELPAVGCITFLHLPQMLQQDRDRLPHDAGVGGHGCQGLQAALPQGAVVPEALLLPL